MRVTYKQRVFLYFTGLFALATALMMVFSVFYALALFVLILVVFSFVFQKYYESIKNLKYFIAYFRNNNCFPSNISFRDEDMREIQSIIREIYGKMQQHEAQIAIEREKLIDHFHYEEEGISFFTPDWENIYTNSHFIQHLNLLLNLTTSDVTVLFKSDRFGEVVRFLENPQGRNLFNTKLNANNRHFLVRVLIFDDKSFEIILRDITELEKSNFNKSEMTNNIAHELLTPVTSICGYLETLLKREDLPSEKKADFLHRAYRQAVRLTDIIEDTVLLSRTNNAPQFFHIEEVNLYDLLKDMIEIAGKEYIEQNGSTVNLLLDKQVTIRGNRTLLYSIFRNLGDNALKYAGKNSTIIIHNYMEDPDFYYFSYTDNGPGIEEHHLDRIFERFYRINEGRTRDTGGSGLGLSIVKDAVTFHHGKIHARNRAGGGLEFLFNLRKY